MTESSDVLKGLPAHMTLGWMASTIQSAMKLQSAPKLHNMKRLDEACGGTSIIFSIDLEVEGKTSGIIVKFPDAMKLEQWKVPGALDITKKLHHNEVVAYGLLNDKGLTIPRCLGSADITEPGTGVLVFERFPKPTRIPDVIQGLSVKHVEVVMTSLAKLHAIGLCSPALIKSGDFGGSVEEMFAEFTKENAEKGMQCWEVVRGRPLNVDHAKLVKMSNCQYWHELNLKPKYPTFSHGDLWAFNLLVFDEGKGMENEFAAILDWQALQIGTIGNDIARVLVHCALFNIVDPNMDHLINLYYAELQKTCKEAYSCNVPFEKQYVIDEIDAHRGCGALYSFYHATINMEGFAKSFEEASKELLDLYYDGIERNLQKALESC